MKRVRSVVIALVGTSIALSACGGSSSSGGEATNTTGATATTKAMEDTATTKAMEDTATTEAMEDTATTEAMEDTATTAAEGTETTVALGGSKANPDALVIWADETKKPAIDAAAPKFTEASGIEVVTELVSFADIRERVTQAGPAGEGPDLFVGAHDWTGELASNGVIDPVDISAKADSFTPVALQGFLFEGKNYAMPYSTEAIAMYRNTDLVPDAPATWDDLVASCDEEAIENCVAIPGGGDAGDAYHNYEFISAYGGGIFAYDPKTGYDPATVLLDSPETVKGVNFLADQVKAGTVPSVNYDGAKNLFLEGKAAYWITGPWERGGLDEQSAVKWDVSLIPQIGDKPIQPFVGVNGFFVSATSTKKLEAQTFLLDFIATDEAQQALYDADPRGSAWKTVVDGYANDPIATTFTESATNGVPMPNIPQMAAVWGPLGDNILLVRNGKQTGDEAMKAAAEAVRSGIAG